LGAFGLGVPTSTISQGSHVTLMSKQSPTDTINFAAISRIDRYKNNRAEVLLEEDLRAEYPELLETELFIEAYDRLSENDKGTVILVQYLHRNCYAAGNEAELTDLKNVAINRLRAYLGLVFQHYIDGTELIDHSAVTHTKQIDLMILGINVDSIDPLMRNMIDLSHDGVKGTHINHGDNIAPVSGRQRPFSVTVAVIPGAAAGGGIRPVAHDEQMKYALAMRREGSGDEGAPITECQGLYLYRNMRLIEFATWKGIYTGGANYTCARAAVYGPVGFNISDQSMLYVGIGSSEGFSCDPSKVSVNLSPDCLNRVKTIIEDENQWHIRDNNRKKAYTRANGRITYDRAMEAPRAPPEPRIPIVGINIDPNNGIRPLEVTFTAENTGPIAATEFTWVINGEQISGEEVIHTFNDAGVFSITLQGEGGGVVSRPTRGQVIVNEIEAAPRRPQPGKNAEIRAFNDPAENVIKYIVSNGGETISLWVNIGSEHYETFIQSFVERFGE